MSAACRIRGRVVLRAWPPLTRATSAAMLLEISNAIAGPPSRKHNFAAQLVEKCAGARKYEGARNRSPWRLRCGDLAGQSDSPPASGLTTCLRLAPSAPLSARLARLPPACTGCPPSSSRRRAILRLSSEATPSSSAVQLSLRLAPQAEPSNPASDRSSGFHRTHYLPATPPDRLSACADAFFPRCG